jgi:uncharacterized integral membrane protein
MTWQQFANVAVVCLLIVLGGALMMAMTSLDRWLTEHRERRQQDRFHSGAWR